MVDCHKGHNSSQGCNLSNQFCACSLFFCSLLSLVVLSFLCFQVSVVLSFQLLVFSFKDSVAFSINKRFSSTRFVFYKCHTQVSEPQPRMTFLEQTESTRVLLSENNGAQVYSQLALMLDLLIQTFLLYLRAVIHSHT